MKSSNLINGWLGSVAGFFVLLSAPIHELGLSLRSDAAERVGVAAWGELGVLSPDTYKYPVRGDLLLENVTTFAEGSSQIFGLSRNGTIVGWSSSPFESSPPTGSGFVAVTGGTQHGVALRSDGTVAVWGFHQFQDVTSVPAGLNGVVALAAGDAHTLALRGNGEVVAWGANWYAQSVVPPGLNRVKSIAARYSLSAAIRFDGSLVLWGDPEYGKTNVPVGLTRVAEVTLGNYVVAARTEEGKVVAWGVPGSEAPADLSGVISIKAGIAHVLALKQNGTVVAWGSNDSGQANVPLGLSHVVAIAAGDVHSVALKQDGSLVAWGSNSGGQTSIPSGVRNVTAIAAWDDVTAAFGRLTPPVITEQPVDQRVGRLQNVRLSVTASGFGSLYRWYRNGRLVSGPSYEPDLIRLGTEPDPIGGNYTVEVSNSTGTVTSEAAAITVGPIAPGTVVGWNPRTVDTRAQSEIPLGLSEVVALSAGALHVLALKEDGTVIAWGENFHGQTTIPNGLRDVVAINAGTYHSVCLQGNGTVVVWGQGFSQSVPPDLTDVVAIAAGFDHTLALKRDGTVIAWGSGEASVVPNGLAGVIAIAAGYDLSIALTTDGSVVEWGRRASGCTFKPRPEQLAGVRAIAAAWTTTLVLKDDGSVEAWGNDCTGQATPPASLRGVVALAGHSDQSFALRADGTLASWGSWGLGYRPRNLGPSSALAVGAFVYEIVGPLPAVRPRMVASGDRLEVRWRSSRKAVTLHVAKTLDPADWQPHPFTGNPENGWIRVPWSASTSYQFFRLISE